jgi:hypothetical protein
MSVRAEGGSRGGLEKQAEAARHDPEDGPSRRAELESRPGLGAESKTVHPTVGEREPGSLPRGWLGESAVDVRPDGLEYEKRLEKALLDREGYRVEQRSRRATFLPVGLRLLARESRLSRNLRSEAGAGLKEAEGRSNRTGGEWLPVAERFLVIVRVLQVVTYRIARAITLRLAGMGAREQRRLKQAAKAVEAAWIRR